MLVVMIGQRVSVLTALGSLFLLIVASVSQVSAMGCPSPPVSIGTTHNGGDTKVFSTGNSIDYACTFGHYSVGETTRICLVDGTWTGTDNICRIDAVSLALACAGGLTAIVIFLCLSCWLIIRKRKAVSRRERHLTIQKENEQRPNGLNGPADHQEESYNKRQSQVVERSDSGLQTDMDLDDANMNDFDEQIVSSPTDNQSPHMPEFQPSDDVDIEG